MSKESSGEEIKLKLDGIVGEPEFNLPEAKLALAKLILCALFILVILTFLASFIPDEFITPRAVKFSENIYQGLVPVVSMVIGYYFAKD